VQIDVLVLDRLPKPLDEHIVTPAALAVHADADVVLLQRGDEVRSGELATLVGIACFR
jgi:hypothetical protein